MISDKQQAIRKSGFAPILLLVVLALMIAVGGIGIGLAWRTNYLDKYLPARVKELLGKEAKPGDQVSDQGEQPGEEPGEEPSKSEEDKTKDWKTFVSPVYGYSIKYPPDWSIAPEAHTDFRAQSPQGGIFEIISMPGLGLQFPEAYFEQEIAAPAERFQQIIVGGKVAMESKTTTLAYVSVTSELVLVAHYYREGYPYSEIEESNFDLLLGSFKFE